MSYKDFHVSATPKTVEYTVPEFKFHSFERKTDLDRSVELGPASKPATLLGPAEPVRTDAFVEEDSGSGSPPEDPLTNLYFHGHNIDMTKGVLLPPQTAEPPPTDNDSVTSEEDDDDGFVDEATNDTILLTSRGVPKDLAETLCDAVTMIKDEIREDHTIRDKNVALSRVEKAYLDVLDKRVQVAAQYNSFPEDVSRFMTELQRIRADESERQARRDRCKNMLYAFCRVGWSISGWFVGYLLFDKYAPESMRMFTPEWGR